MTSDITWPHIRIISLKVIKSLQGKESHTNTQKLDQDIKFTPRRTWPPWSNDVICPTGWPCGRMLWSAHIPLANEQGLWMSLSYANFIWRHWIYKMPVRYNLSSVWVRLSIFSRLSIIQCVGLCVFSLPISMIEIIYILCRIIIIKSEVWTITHCIGLGHETMVCAVHVFLYSYQNSHHQIIISGFKYPENRSALQYWITEFKFIFQIWHGLQPSFNNIIDPNQENCANTFGCVGFYKYKIFWNECLMWANIDVIQSVSTIRSMKYIIIHLYNH